MEGGNTGGAAGPGGTGTTPQLPPTILAIQNLVQRHETRFGALENKLETAFASVIARLDALTPTPPQNPADPPQAAAPDRPGAREPKLAGPKTFEGDFELCRGFLVQCELIFRHQTSRYSTDGAKIAYVMSLLSGRALKWATAAVGQSSSLASSYSAFRDEFTAVFDHPVDGADAASRLHSIQQGSRSVADYTLEFRILAADSEWGDKALQSAYRRGLSEAVKDGLLRDRPTSYNALIELALQMDQRLKERRLERTQRASSVYSRPAVTETRASPSSASVSNTPPGQPVSTLRPASSPVTSGADEPMQLGRSRLAAAERERRFQQRLCLYCGLAGHVIRECPTRPKDEAR